MLSRLDPLDDLLALAKNRLEGLVAGQLYPAPGNLITAPLDIFLIDVPPRNSNPQRPEGAPCVKLAPLDGERSDAPGNAGEERFEVQFVWYAAEADGKSDPLTGYQLMAAESAEIMRSFLKPLQIGNWILNAKHEHIFGRYVATADGIILGRFAAPYYHVTYVCSALKINKRK